MDKDLRIIFLEDVPAEADAVERILRENGLSVQLKRVDKREDFVYELESSVRPDIILSDHGLPAFDGLSALALAQTKCPEVPFIFVTNALTWEMDIDKLYPAVTDFVAKRDLKTLAPTIRRALYHAEMLKQARLKLDERQQIVEKLLALLAEYEPKNGYLPICASCKKIRDGKDQWHIPEEFFRARLGLKFTHGVCPECTRKLYGV
jgi:DNA-binding NtrC family response regulator